MIGTIICKVGIIMCDIGTINVRFYLLEIPNPYGYCRITLKGGGRINETFLVFRLFQHFYYGNLLEKYVYAPKKKKKKRNDRIE